MSRTIFVTGGTGYVGRALIPVLLAQGHTVRALVRPGSEKKLPAGCQIILGDPLHKESFVDKIAPADTFIQLVGVPHPSPAKAEQFRRIDLVSAQQSIQAAVQAHIRHFIYLSVAQPAPVMKVYQEVRAQAEQELAATGLPASVFRPWYVLGPGHQWPQILRPFYAIAAHIPSMRDSARRLDFVTLDEMVRALAYSVEVASTGFQIYDVPNIQKVASS